VAIKVLTTAEYLTGDLNVEDSTFKVSLVIDRIYFLAGE
jgi:hypothetical protein